LVVKKAADAYIRLGTDPVEFITNHKDDYDFFLRTKVPKNSRLVGDWGYEEEVLQNVTRYYVSNEGCELIKIMPPLAKNPGKERRIAVSKGCKVTVMNKLAPLDRSTIDRKSTRLNSSHVKISYAVVCLKKKNTEISDTQTYLAT